MTHFTHEELAPPELAAKGREYVSGLFKPHALAGLEALREAYGKPIGINNWATGGNRKNCGYRVRSCSVGAALSPHKAGMAFDLHASDIEDLRAFVLAHGAEFGIRRVEHKDESPTWVHIDFKEHDRPGIRVFHP